MTRLVDNAGDFAEFDRLFRVCFGGPADPAVHRWKYARAGAQQVALAADDGSWSAYYGIMPREVLVRGAPLVAAQGCDVMVHPRARSLSREGALFRVAKAAFTAAFAADARVRLSYGFPSRRHVLAAARRGMYQVLGEVVECAWQARAAAVPERITEDGLAAALRPAWQAMREDTAQCVVGVRTPEWALDRFFRHPAASQYALYTLPAEAAAFAVRRHADRLELVDVIAPTQALPACVEGARAVCAAAGLESVFGWFVDWAPPLLGPVTAVRSIGVLIPNQIMAPGGVKLERDEWWLTAADSDFH